MVENFPFIVCGLWYLLCCDLYKEVKIAAFIYIYIYIYIYTKSLFLHLDGGKILIWDVMHFWESVFLPYWTPAV
jgi:hypothetical protein